jgi:hypothetical protein
MRTRGRLDMDGKTLSTTFSDVGGEAGDPRFRALDSAAYLTYCTSVVVHTSGSACGHPEPRTSKSEARDQRKNALGVGPQRQ